MSKKTWEMGSEFMENSSREGKNEYAMLLNFPKRYVLSGRTVKISVVGCLKSLGYWVAA